MNGILLTQNSTFIIGQVAWLLGKIMDLRSSEYDRYSQYRSRNHPFYNCC